MKINKILKVICFFIIWICVLSCIYAEDISLVTKKFDEGKINIEFKVIGDSYCHDDNDYYVKNLRWKGYSCLSTKWFVESCSASSTYVANKFTVDFYLNYTVGDSHFIEYINLYKDDTTSYPCLTPKTSLYSYSKYKKNGSNYYKYYYTKKSSINVDLSVANDSGCGLSSIKYSIDNGRYQSLGVANNSTISISGSNQTRKLKVLVTDRLGNTRTNTIYIVFDSIAPSFTQIFDSSNGKWVKSAIVTATARDGLSGIDVTTWQYSINGGIDWSSESSKNYSVNLTKTGIYYVQFRVSDYAGNTVTSNHFITHIDNFVPVINIRNGSSKWKNKTVKLVAFIRENTNNYSQYWQYKKTTEEKFKTKTSNVLSLSETGIYTVQLTVTDEAGNISNTAKKTVKIDKNKPVVNILGSKTGWVSTNVTLKSDITDATSNFTKEWNYSSNGGKTWTRIAKDTLTFINSGNYLVKLTATDEAGNISVENTQVLIDKDLPKVNILNKIENWTNKNVTLVADVSDNTSTVYKKWQYKKNNGTIQTSTGNSLKLTESGIYNVTLQATDSANNKKSSSTIIKIDKDIPSVSIENSSTDWTKKDVNITAHINDFTTASSNDYSSKTTKTWKYSVDDKKTWKTSSSNVLTFTKSGCYNIQLIATDEAGNISATAHTTVLIDKIDPILNVKSSAISEWVNDDVTVDVSVADSLSGINYSLFQYSLNDIDWTTVSNKSIKFSQPGEHKIKFKAYDTVGNKQTTDFIEVKIDRTKPTIDNINIIQEFTNASTLSVTAIDDKSGVDNASYKFWDDAGTIVNSENEFIEKEDGAHIIYCKVSDNAGNVSDVTKLSYTIDTVPPVLTYTCPDFAKITDGKIQLQLNNIFYDDETSDVTYLKYAIDEIESDRIEINAHTKVSKLDITIPNNFINISDLKEGKHSLSVRAVDSKGLVSNENIKYFIVDKTAPEVPICLLKYDIQQDGKENFVDLNNGDFVGTNTLKAEITAKDYYQNSIQETTDDENSQQEGQIVEYEYGISNLEDEEPTSYTECDSSIFEITGLSAGLNFIYVKLIDQSGNETISDKNAICEVLLDLNAPGKPIIKSSTHTRAQNLIDCELSNDPNFTIKPNMTFESGLQGYMWQLQTCELLNSKDINIKPYDITEKHWFYTDNEMPLSFSDLPDNLEGEYYRLVVQCIGGNGLIGEEESYRFRIDTTPPHGLVIACNPQACKSTSEGANWYNSTDAFITWNKPYDMTGVAKYVYTISEESAFTKDDTTWTKLDENAVRVKVIDLFKDKKAGIIKIGVSAYDYAENKESATRSFYVDLIKPKFSSEIIQITGTDINNTTTKTIQWESVMDEDSGVQGVVLNLTGVSGEDASRRKITFTGGESQSYEFSTLKKDTVYYVSLTGIDNAGNTSEISTTFDTYNSEAQNMLPESIAIDYEENYAGYFFTGTKIIEYENEGFEESSEIVTLQNVSMEVPDEISIVQIIPNEDGDGNNEHLLTQLSFKNAVYGTEGILSATNYYGLYSVTINGFKVSGTSISFNRNEGLLLNNVVYERKVIQKDIIEDTYTGNEEDYLVNLNTVIIGFPPVPVIESAKMQILPSVAIKTDGFTLENVSSVQLGNKKEKIGLNEGTTTFNPSFGNNLDLPINLSCNDGNKNIPLKTVSLDADSTNPVAKVAANDLILELGGNEYTIINSGIRGNEFEVYEAIISLPENYEPQSLVIRNFSINNDTGTVSMKSDFICEKLTENTDDEASSEDGLLSGITADGVPFNLDELLLTEDGNLFSSGFIQTNGYGQIKIHNLVLTNEGIDLESGCDIDEFKTSVFNFPVTGKIVQFISNQDFTGVRIESGTINVLSGEREFTGLELEIDEKDNVNHQGIGEEVFYVTSSGYGEDPLITLITIEKDGVYASVTAPLPYSDAVWTYEHATINTNNTFSVTSKKAKNLILGGFTITTENSSFDGNSIVLHDSNVVVPDGFSVSEVALNNVKFNAKGILEAGTLANKVEYDFDNWNCVPTSLGISEKGLTGACVLSSEPEIVEGYTINSSSILYENFTIFYDGSIESGDSSFEEDDSVFMYNQYYIHFPSAKMAKQDEKYTTECDFPYVIIDESVKQKLYLGKIIFDSSSNIIEAKDSDKIVSFESMNYYKVITSKVVIKDGGIWIAGEIKPLNWKKSVVVPDSKIFLDQRARVTYADSEAAITYRYANWNITSQNVDFGLHKVTIEKNDISYRGKEIELGILEFSNKGELCNEVETAQSGTINVYTDNSQLLDSCFSDEGVVVSIVAVLPSEYQNKTMYVKNVHLFEDGTFYVDYVIDRYTLNLGAVLFDFQYIHLTEDGFKIEYADISIPGLENVKISLRGIKLSSNGNIELLGVAVSPFKLFNMTFCISDLSINNGIIGLEGYVSLPNEMPGVLSGRIIGIHTFEIKLEDGKPQNIEIDLEGEYTIPFLNDWNLVFTDLAVMYENEEPSIVLKKAELIFPSDFTVANSASINEVSYNLSTKQFNYEKIQADINMDMEYGGLLFSLTSLSITKDMTVGFGGKVKFTSNNFPDFLQNKTADIKKFEIEQNGFGDIDVELSGLNGQLSPDIAVLELKDGIVNLKKEGDSSLVLGIEGNLVFTNSAPESFRGTAIKIDTFKIDCMNLKDTQISASLAKETSSGTWTKNRDIIGFSPVIYGTQLHNIFISFDWDGSVNDGDVKIAGEIILPECLPAAIGGNAVSINTFTIGMDGQIDTFDVSCKVSDTKIAAIELSDVYLNVNLNDKNFCYTTTATMTLPKTAFPEGIGGLQTKAEFLFTNQELIDVNAECSIPNRNLFGTLQSKNVSFTLQKTEHNPLEFSLHGSLLLPDTFPSGLANTEIAISKLTINSYGQLKDLDIGLHDFNTTIFNAVVLHDGALDFSRGTDNDFIINITGDISLNKPNIPKGLKGKSLQISELLLSTKNGLLSFTAGLNSGLQFTLLGGLDFSIHEIILSESGFGVDATVVVNYKNACFTDTKFELKKFKMGWDGTLLDIQGGLQSTTLKLGGFNCQIAELYALKHNSSYVIALKECRLILPANFGSMGRQSIALKDATFDPITGAFKGDVEVPELRTEIAGFTMVLENPTVSIQKKKIEFSKASLLMPEFMGSSSVSLKGVEISATEGLKTGGGKFTLPDFAVGEVGFKNIGAEFLFTGDNPYICGYGGIMIPGAGMLEAKLSFTKRSATYPIGLKQAYFSYEIAVGGIPLGTTGLYLSGIRGGLAFGEPKEIPAKYRGLFTNGTRIQLGLKVKDKTGGKAFIMDTDTWIDITNIAMVFKGNATVLKGTLNIAANTSAVMMKNCFATQMSVEIAFVNGFLEMYLFGLNDELKFSGQGIVSFKVPKGKFYDGSIVDIPDKDWWFADIGAQFGDFINGERGILGYINVNFCGIDRIGAFVGNNGLKTQVSSYEILVPEGIKRNVNNNVRSISTFDQRDIEDSEVQTYTVTIPSKTEISNIPDKIENTRAVGARSITTQNVTEEGPGKIIFIIGFLEGDPTVTAISPSGIIYTTENSGVSIEYFKNGMSFAVDSPECGDWNIDVKGIDKDQYELAVLGIPSIPTLTITEPKTLMQISTNTVQVAGTVDSTGKKIYVFAVSNQSSPGIKLGNLVSDKNGNYAGNVSIVNLVDGEYQIYVQTATTDGYYSPAVYSKGGYIIDRSSMVLKAPQNLRVAEIDDGTLQLTWQSANEMRTSGYYLTTKNLNLKTETRENIGNITTLAINGYELNSKIEFSVAAYDDELNESTESNIVTIVVGAKKTEFNIPSINKKEISTSAYIGGSVTGFIPYTIDSLYETNESVGYILMKQKNDLDYITIAFDKAQKVEQIASDYKWDAYIDEKCPAGKYECECEIVNEANNNLSDIITFYIQVLNPAPQIQDIEPSEIDGSKDTTIKIYGVGFISGSRYFYDEQEVAVQEDEYETCGMKVLKIPKTATRGTKILKVIGPDNQSVQSEITAVLPDWKVNLYSTLVEVQAGEIAEYPVKMEGLDGYIGSAVLQTKKTGPFFAVTKPILSVGNTQTIAITVPKDAKDGTYVTVLSGGEDKEFELTTVVSSSEIAPVITSIAPLTGFAGNTIILYGYGFQNKGELLLNGKQIETSKWSNASIQFNVTNEFTSGNLKVKIGNSISNSIKFTVRECGFTLRPASTEVKVVKGETKQVNLAVTGYADRVSLTTSHSPTAPFTVELSKNSINPNAVISVKIKPFDNAVNGTWSLVIKGKASGYSTSTELLVTIGDVFEITTKTIPQGYCGVVYKSELKTIHAQERVLWSLSDGNLPTGLSLSQDGIIYGISEKPSVSTLTVKAVDEDGQIAKQQLEIVVEDDIWGQNAKNGGKTRASATKVPSTSKVCWHYDSDKKIKNVLVTGEDVIAVQENNVIDLNHNGQLNWTAKKNYTKQAISGSYFYGLTDSGILEIRDLNIGLTVWSRTGVQSFTTDGEYLLTKENSGNYLINATNGCVLETLKTTYVNAEKTVWCNNVAYEFDATSLRGLYNASRKINVTDTKKWGSNSGTVFRVSCDANGFVIATEKAIVLVDSNLLEINRIERSVKEKTQIGLDKTGIFVQDEYSLTEYSRTNGSLKWTSRAGNSFAIGSEKAVVIDDFAIRVINRYSGQEIWNEQGTYSAVALYSEKIYAAKDNSLYVYNGKANASSPTTFVTFTPSNPDGTNDWYKTIPSVEITALDTESYVDTIQMSFNCDTWKEYVANPELEEGYTNIKVYSIDSKNLRGDTTDKTIKVDVTKPQSSYVLSDIPSSNGWFHKNVLVKLEATDALSGIDSIQTQNGEYKQTILFKNDGIHTLEWYAVDKAGNREEKHILTIKIDKTAPYVTATVQKSSGISLVSLQASDSETGVKTLEYKLDDTVAKEYIKPIVLLELGKHKIEYRAVDLSNLSSIWKTVYVYVTQNDQWLSLIAFPKLNGANRETKYPAMIGESFYNFDSNSISQKTENTINQLPVYAQNGEFIIWNEKDFSSNSKKSTSFYAKKDLIVYLFIDSDEMVSSEWTQIEDEIHVQDYWYKNGCTSYMKWARKGEKVILTDPDYTGVIPLVVVQEVENIQANIQIVNQYTNLTTTTEIIDKNIYEDGMVLLLYTDLMPINVATSLPLKNYWYVDEGNGYKKILNHIYTVPKIKKEQQITLRVEVCTPDGKIICTSEKAIRIKMSTENTKKGE